MTCARCPNPSPITVEQAGVELCRGCADLGAEKTTAPSEPGASTSGRPATHLRHDGRIATSLPPPARPARSKR